MYNNKTTLVFQGSEVVIEHIIEPLGQQENHDNGNVHQRFRCNFKDLKNDKDEAIELLLIHDGERFIIAF